MYEYMKRKVLKFGGSSVQNADCIRKIIAIIQNLPAEECLGVVVSAFAGVTDQLISLGHQALANNYADAFQRLKQQHVATVQNLLSGPRSAEAIAHVGEKSQQLEDALKGIALIKELSKRSLDYIMSFGEYLSAYIISHALQESLPAAYFLDARPLVKTDSNYNHARVDFCQTNRLIQAYMLQHEGLPIITGFIGSSENDDTTTLGRGGSDYTAAIFAAALHASEVQIWTDVDGVMTADPRKVRQAFPLPCMSYKEALEMSHFGAKIIYPPTIAPVLKQQIPLVIKNTFNPEAPGTYISSEHQNKSHVICGLTSIDQIAFLRVEGSGMAGVCGIAMRLFGTLAKKEISVVLISQGSSEHTICFAIAPQQSQTAKRALEEEFALEMQAGLIDPIVVEQNLSIIAAVGENMRKTPGIAGRLFNALGKNGINIIAIVQGSSEFNISIVLDQRNESKALNAIHEEFFLSALTTLHVFLVGVGLIGSTLLEQIQEHLQYVREELAIEIKVIALADSQKMLIDTQGLDLKHWHGQLQQSGENSHIQQFVQKMKDANLSNSIFIDCTADENVAAAYEAILEIGISIVTPNKLANSSSYSRYKSLKELAKRHKAKFLYETNVGAGLPIISTIADLRHSGDKIIKVEALLSGTLSFVFNELQQGLAFSQALKAAAQKGLTEPDASQDLNGQDVKRKLLIIARECGYPLEMAEIKQERLIPEGFETCPEEIFFQKIAQYDAMFEAKRQLAASQGKVLRHIASFENAQASISLQEVGPDHPFYSISGSDNIISVYTERYRETPLVIKGPGAGAAVTAGELFADIIRLAAR